MHLPVAQLMVAYMTRAGNVPLERFAATAPDVVHAALEQYGDTTAPRNGIVDWVLEGRTAPDDADLATIEDVPPDPWDDDGDAAVARARAARERGAAGVRLRGPADRAALLTRLDLAERIRTETGALTVVDGPEALRDDLAAGLVSARTDLVSLTDPEPA